MNSNLVRYYFVIALLLCSNDHFATSFGLNSNSLRRISQPKTGRNGGDISISTSTVMGMSGSSSISVSSGNSHAKKQLMALPQYLVTKQTNEELYNVICATASACVLISQNLQRATIANYIRDGDSSDNGISSSNLVTNKINVQGEVQKDMDVIANDIFIEKVSSTVAVMASEEEEYIVPGKFHNTTTSYNDNNDSGGSNSPNETVYEIAFDPLDGSSNLDVNIPTGTIFGISPHNPNKPFASKGRSLIAAGYAIYSSSVEFILSLGPSGSGGCAGFTLDPTLLYEFEKDQNSNIADCFILSRPNMKCPPSGPYYSLNDGREPDWPDGLRKWIYDAKRGQTPSKTTFSSRYVCSLVADVHRTLIKGGWAGNPRPHLRLLYEAAPLAHVVEASGGKGSDGVNNLLDLVPTSLHDRTCVFLGSLNDIQELESYGDVQQGVKKYDN